MKISDVNWLALGTVVSTGTLMFGAISWLLRAKLGTAFVTRVEHREMLDRLKEVEQTLSSMPRHSDMLALERRFGEVAERVSGVNSSVQGIKEDLSAVRYQLNMLIDAQLKAEATTR